MPATGTVRSTARLRQVETVAVAGMARSYKSSGRPRPCQRVAVGSARFRVMHRDLR